MLLLGLALAAAGAYCLWAFGSQQPPGQLDGAALFEGGGGGGPAATAAAAAAAAAAAGTADSEPAAAAAGSTQEGARSASSPDRLAAATAAVVAEECSSSRAGRLAALGRRGASAARRVWGALTWLPRVLVWRPNWKAVASWVMCMGESGLSRALALAVRLSTRSGYACCVLLVCPCAPCRGARPHWLSGRAPLCRACSGAAAGGGRFAD